MRLVLHPKVYSDIDQIMAYYEQIATTALANDFYAELRPNSFAIRKRDIRRVNLNRFPYHFLFRVVDDEIRILVVRHHGRHPSLGIRRR
jgi:plasmid stabilization system protein ParE